MLITIDLYQFRLIGLHLFNNDLGIASSILKYDKINIMVYLDSNINVYNFIDFNLDIPSSYNVIGFTVYSNSTWGEGYVSDEPFSNNPGTYRFLYHKTNDGAPHTNATFTITAIYIRNL